MVTNTDHYSHNVPANKMARDPPNVALSAAGASPSDIAKIRPPGRAGRTDKEKAPFWEKAMQYDEPVMVSMFCLQL